MSEPIADSQWMRRALQLAAQGEGRVEPNPMVGCLLVDHHTSPAEVLGEGYHARFGGPHAERQALDDARARGNAARLTGATAYVTLEPCCHFGKTPPCVAALLEAKIGRVVVAMPDPFAQVSGQGIAELERAGVEVVVGMEQAAAEELNAPYLKRLRQARPWVIAKWAMSLDGRLASRTGHSQWISGEASRARVHQLRSRVDAILVGSGTALADDPRLTARTPEPLLRTAMRVVVDSQLRLPLASQLATTARSQPVLLWAGPEAHTGKARHLRELGCQVHLSEQADPLRRLDALLSTLATEFQATNILVEGGGKLLGSLLELQQIDACEVFVAPKILGGENAISPVLGSGIASVDDCPRYRGLRIEQCGDDVHIRCRLSY